MTNKNEQNLGLKGQNEKNYSRRIFDSPSSKARILTPVKNALYKSDGDAYKFLKAVQNIVDKTDKENVSEETLHAEKFNDKWEI